MTSLLLASLLAAPQDPPAGPPIRWTLLTTVGCRSGRAAGVEMIRSERTFRAWWAKIGRGDRPTGIDWTRQNIAAVRVGELAAQQVARVVSIEPPRRGGSARNSGLLTDPGADRFPLVVVNVETDRMKPPKLTTPNSPIFLLRTDKTYPKLGLLVKFPGSTSDPFRVIVQGADARGASRGLTVLDSATAYADWWRLATDRPDAPPKGVDWKKERVLAISSGVKPSGGWGVVVDRIDRPKTGPVIVWIREQPPEGMASQVLTYPYALLAVPRDNRTYVARMVTK